MNRKYFHEELRRLKELGAEFAEDYPAIAPMMGGPTPDPDAERLLEGAAFNIALLREKLEGDFPEIVHDLTRLSLPHYPRRFPPSTIVAFNPKSSLEQSSLIIPAGTQLASTPVDGTSCIFTTAWDVELHPLQFTDAVLVRTSARKAQISLSLTLKGITLSRWRPKGLRIFLSGDRVSATDLYMLTGRHLRRIIISPAGGGAAVVLPPSRLKPVGFDTEESLTPYPSHAFPAYRLLPEYFTTPEKFLFLEITGWERWENRGDGAEFTVTFELEGFSIEPPRIRCESFALFAVPAVNIFPHEADPILLDHRRSRYLVRPSGPDPAHYPIFAIDRVIGFCRDTGLERRYAPFELFDSDAPEEPVYHATFEPSPVRSGTDAYLSVAYPQGSPISEEETLSIGLTCTNGTLPEDLRVGDVCLPTDAPLTAESFRNITPVNSGVSYPFGPELLERLNSHLSLDFLSLDGADNLVTLLELYIPSGDRSKAAVAANLKRVEGIEEVRILPCRRSVGGVMMRGRDIRIRMRRDHFSGLGDMYLFGCVLGRFLGEYASINTFTRLTIEETLKGETFEWPARLGDHPLRSSVPFRSGAGSSRSSRSYA